MDMSMAWALLVGWCSGDALSVALSVNAQLIIQSCVCLLFLIAVRAMAACFANFGILIARRPATIFIAALAFGLVINVGWWVQLTHQPCRCLWHD